MRVTPGMMNAQVQRELQAALAAIAHQQDLLSSGTRILAPADDPGGASQAVTIRARQAANAQFQKNVATAKDVLRRLIPTLGPPRTCECPRLLANAVITSPKAFPPATRKRLELLIGRYFPKGRRRA